MNNRNLPKWGRLQSSTNNRGQVEEHSGEIRNLDRPQEHGFASRAPVGSKTVTISQSADNSIIVMCAGETPIELDEGDAIIYSAGGASAHLEGGKVIINGGVLGGLIDIATQTEKINDLVTIFNAHVHTAPNTVTATLQTPLVQADYENTDVTHG